jgi:hypothetical protein
MVSPGRIKTAYAPSRRQTTRKAEMVARIGIGCRGRRLGGRQHANDSVRDGRTYVPSAESASICVISGSISCPMRVH